MTREDLQKSMVNYATHALNAYIGEQMRPVLLDDGTVVFEATGEPVDQLPPRPPVH